MKKCQLMYTCLNFSSHFKLVWIWYVINTYIKVGGIILNNNNLDIAKMISMLSKMDKKDLEAGLAKANQILQSKNKDEILREINKNK